ncbi:MAG: hypothetical protein K2N94_01450 [Lachnospiraceae bacterium]|nr:hypothetical protein [Lachnospiraceae bacterium]
MAEWWNGLSPVLQVLYCIAIPSTLLLVIQTILTLIGFGEGGAGVNPSDTSGLDLDMNSADVSVDAGVDVDVDMDGADGIDSDFGTLRLFTFQGIIAFFTTFAWMTICLVRGEMQIMPALLLGGLCGVIIMYVVAKLLQWSAKLAENGTFNIKGTIGENAQVYVPIPAAGESGGKVTLTMPSGFVELNAITEEAEAISAGAVVRVTDVVGDTVIVERM